MARVVGIDPGTGSMDVLGFDDESGRVFLEESIPRDEVTRDPSLPLRIVEEASRRIGGLDAVVAPSGYGMPLKRAAEATAWDICEATFIHSSDEVLGLRIVGLRRLMALFSASSLPAWFTPGVIHLPTVPSWRKVGRIDMGTADKLYTVAAALKTEVESHGVAPKAARFIAVEAGMAYTAAIAVVDGKVVDGVGGTSGFHGFMGGGAMDGEVAYALAAVAPRFSKAMLFKGGAGWLAGVSSPAELEEKAHGAAAPSAEAALEMLGEGVVKSVAALLPSLRPEGGVVRVYVSGRLFSHGRLGRELEGRLEDFISSLGLTPRILRVERLGSKTKEGATGAALIASGLAGGRYKWIVDQLELARSSGSIFDHLPVDDDLRKAIRLEFRSCAPLGEA
ncbi:DUF1464 family protein [Aeropyrum camini]|uniref:Predicted butyrate kinase n=1 Tax=Aeropyrum camini SY1 = JCM 12091 TaxID=1198449 RepID=U3TEZ7_9CREN|nr:DUF1464 family protein [Aeropyrum camini]BAN91031.1 predicted butyrate kinase [Aeropyrum camini SY1 = JCM 12091]